MGKNIWLSMRPRNFTSAFFTLMDVKYLTSFLIKSPRHKQIVFKLDIGHPCYDQLTAVKIGIR